MSAHLSDLTLDELLAELPVAEADALHVRSCVQCAERLEALKAERLAFHDRLDAARMRQRLERATPRTEPRRSTRWVLAVSTALAASLLLFIAWPGPGTRLKGSPVVELKNANGTTTTAHVGESLSVWVGGGTYEKGALVAVEANGHVSCLWSGDVLPGINAVQRLSVTPGDVAVWLFAAHQSLTCVAAEAQVQRAVAAVANSPLSAEPSPVQDGATVSVLLHVVP